MKLPRITLTQVVTAVAALMLLVALPSALRDTLETGRIYLFSREFLDDLPQRLTGPGRLRFVLQPLAAVVLGIRGGLADVRAGRPSYLIGLILGGTDRRELLRSGFIAIRNLMAAGIALDAVAQLLIHGHIHPGAALVIGPVLIALPYSLARAVTHNIALRMRRRGSNK